jgi:membrane fusion protein, copper/silver efflux system
MKKIIVFLLLTLLVAGAAYAKGYEVAKKAGDYAFEVRIDKNPPIVGNNTMEVFIKDASGKAVIDGKVLVEYTMPPMSGMAPMSYKTDATLKGEKYVATMKLSMAGPWNVSVKLTRGGKTDTIKLTIDAK